MYMFDKTVHKNIESMLRNNQDVPDVLAYLRKNGYDSFSFFDIVNYIEEQEDILKSSYIERLYQIAYELDDAEAKKVIQRYYIAGATPTWLERHFCHRYSIFDLLTTLSSLDDYSELDDERILVLEEYRRWKGPKTKFLKHIKDLYKISIHRNTLNTWLKDQDS
jgi:hypothetical protein